MITTGHYIFSSETRTETCLLPFWHRIADTSGAQQRIAVAAQATIKGLNPTQMERSAHRS